MQILTSIKPLALIINAFVTDSDSVHALFDSEYTNRHALLTTSQLEMLKNSDLVFFITQDFKVFLTKSQHQEVIDQSKLVSLGNMSGLRLLRVRRSGQMPHVIHNQYENRFEQKQGVFNQRFNNGIDWHIWLNPDNAILIAMKVRDELTKIDPNKEVIYQQRFEEFRQELLDLNAKISKKMMQSLGQPFFVLHDRLQYFEEQFGIEAKGIILENRQLNLSAHQLLKLRKVMHQFDVRKVVKAAADSNFAIDKLETGDPFEIIEIDSLARDDFAHFLTFHEYFAATADKFLKALSQ